MKKTFKEYLKEKGLNEKNNNWYVTVELRDAKKAKDLIDDMFEPELKNGDLKMTGAEQWSSNLESIMDDVVEMLKDKNIGIDNTNVEE